MKVLDKRLTELERRHCVPPARLVDESRQRILARVVAIIARMAAGASPVPGSDLTVGVDIMQRACEALSEKDSSVYLKWEEWQTVRSVLRADVMYMEALYETT